MRSAFSNTARALSLNQNWTPYWNSSDAKITTSRVGTAATVANRATRRTWSRAPAVPRRRAVSSSVMRRAMSTISAISGSRLATRTSVTSGGE